MTNKGFQILRRAAQQALGASQPNAIQKSGGVAVTIHFDFIERGAIDVWIAEQGEGKFSRVEAVRRLVSCGIEPPRGETPACRALGEPGRQRLRSLAQRR